MHDVYISYTRDDQRAAKLIDDRLRSEGFSVFMDTVALVAGEYFSEINISEIRSAGVVLALLSSSSGKRSVADQLQAALDNKKLVISVLLDRGAKDNWVWPLLATRQSVELDLASPQSQSQLDKLVEDLSALLGKNRQMKSQIEMRQAPAPSTAVVHFGTHNIWPLLAAAVFGALLAYLITKIGR